MSVRDCTGWSTRTSSSPGSRAGVVLLLVLVAMVIMSGSLVAWMQAVAATRREGVAALDLQQQVDLLASGERLARAWITTTGQRAVAPEVGGGWTVVRDRIRGASGSAELEVTVYDGWAGLPLSLLHVRGSLRRSLPPSFSSLVIPQVQVPDEERLLGPQDFIERVTLPTGMRVGDMVEWSVGGIERPTPALRPLPASASMPLALAISPHSNGAINLNTAPMHLVETVCRLRGIGVPEHLRARRRGGLHSPAPAGADQIVGLPSLVDHSLVWNCLITVRWSGRERSWWVVMVGTATNLRMVQRHDASS